MNRLFLKHVGITVILFLTAPLLWAQTQSTSIDETMRSHDKIYVVMAVCVVILIVFLLYLIRIDWKVSKKEKSL
ncbi:MAG: CcmD family protein [Ginsengibacter sp.]